MSFHDTQIKHACARMLDKSTRYQTLLSQPNLQQLIIYMQLFTYTVFPTKPLIAHQVLTPSTAHNVLAPRPSIAQSVHRRLHYL